MIAVQSFSCAFIAVVAFTFANYILLDHVLRQWIEEFQTLADVRAHSRKQLVTAGSN